jgi:hypothetical protein
MSLPLLPLRQQERELQVQQRPESRSLTASPQMLRAECGKQFSCASDLKRMHFALAGNSRGVLSFVGLCVHAPITFRTPIFETVRDGNTP